MGAAPHAAAIAGRLGRYNVLKHIASGGMADVLLARSDGIEGFERHVVLKRIRPEHAKDKRFITMFLDEARVAASLHHQNIVQVHDIGESSGEYFFAMEYLHGEDLRKILSAVAKSRNHMPLAYVVQIVSAVAAGLHYAHERKGNDKKSMQIVHRDVSPSNIFVGYDGSIKIVDFGIAKAAMRQVETRSGSLKGKVSYMSPEQCKGEAIDRRSDVYSLGVVLYELATTTRLFKGETEYLMMDAIVNGKVPLPRVRRPDLPNELSSIIMRALAVDSARRFQTADELRMALDQFAVRAGFVGSVGTLATFMRKLFGEKPEPWLALDGEEVQQRPSPLPQEPGVDGDAATVAASHASWTEIPRNNTPEDFTEVLADEPKAVGTGTGQADEDVEVEEFAAEGAQIMTSPLPQASAFEGTIPPPMTKTGNTGRRTGPVAAAVEPPLLEGEVPMRPSTIPPTPPTRPTDTRTSMKLGWENQSLPAAPRRSRAKIAALLAVPTLAIGALVGWKLMGSDGDGSTTSGTQAAALTPPTITHVDPPKTTPPPPPPVTTTPPTPNTTSEPDPTPVKPAIAPPTPPVNEVHKTTPHPKQVPTPPREKKEPVVVARNEPAKIETKKEPAKTEPVKIEPAKVDPVKTEPTKTEPTKVEPAKTDPVPPPTTPTDVEPVMGSISSSVVSNVASTHGKQLIACEGGAELKGEVIVAFQVGADGHVTKAQLSSTIKNPKVAGCILRAVHSWVFPKPPTGAAKGVYSTNYQ
jgi:serine/threonine-protein kinase